MTTELEQCPHCRAPQSQWVKISERLPDKKMPVLLSSGTWCVIACFHPDRPGFSSLLNDREKVYMREIKWWMPLPLPSEGE